MPFGLSGVSMGRLSSQSERYQEKRRQQESQQQQQNQHRPTQSVDQVTRVSRLALLKDAASATFKPSKSLSWLPSLMRKAVHPPVMIRSAQELHRVLAPVPPIPAAAASSSMKSDPSSVRDEYRSSGRWLANKPSAAPSVGGLPESDESGQPHQRWLRAERSLYESSISDGSDGLSFRSVSPASAATSISMADQKMQRRAGQQFDEEVSANVLELIQETEQAFEAVGNAINDASSVSRLPDSLHLAAPSPNVPRHHSQGPSAPSAERLQPVPPPPKAAEPKLSAKKSGNALRRAMMEGVGSKLLGQRFKRIVADEMLTPARIEELKKKREQAEAEEEAKLQLACDVSNNEQIDMTDTPEEPFHLERFVTHDDAPAVESPPKSSEVNDRHLNAVTDVETTHLAPPQQGGSSQASAEYTAMTDDMPLDNTSFLMAPSRSPTPGRLTPEPRRLSTIPEIIVDSSPRQSLQESAVATTRHQQRRNSDDDFIYLNGTDISFTNRSFRHGPIACHRPEPTKRDAELEVDESVDWTAFHMAIMGGAGDLASGLYEDEQEDMAEEMAKWFDEFGFETHGQLIPSCDDSSRSSSQSDTSSSPSTVDLDADLPIPVHMEQPNLYHAHSRSDGSVDPTAGPFDAIRFFRSSSLKRWRAMEEPAYWAPSIRRNSGRKPMKRPDPLVVGNEDYGYGDVSETVADMAPMSCNLENDLGDYLRWGSQHVGDSM